MTKPTKTLFFLLLLISISYSQDLIITTEQTFEDTTIILNGNLIVKAGGSLTLNTVILKLDCQFDGQYRIEVESEGALYIYRHSNITANDLNNRFAFAVHGSSFEMRNSELHGAGWGEEDELNNDFDLVMSGSKGLIITTNSAILDSNIFSNNHVGVIIADSGAVISNNQFYNNHAQSLYVRDAKSLTVSGNYILNETGSAALHITSDNNNRYINNEIISNHGHGIVTGNSHYSIIEDNIIHAELISIFMVGSCTNNLIKGNDILSNEVGMQIWGWNNIIRNNTITSYWGWMGTGIYMIYAYNSIVEDNILTDVNEENGIWLRHSSNNLIKNNYIEAKQELPGGRSSGILLFGSSKDNIVEGNQVSQFHRGISIFYSSNNNIIYGNTVTSSNHQGLIIDDADSNYIFSNNVFTNNGKPHFDNGTNIHDYQGTLPIWEKIEEPDLYEFLDEYITGNETIENQTLELANVIIEEGASLTINNSTLITGKNGSSGFHVANGASLYIYNSKIIMHEYGNGFELSPGQGSTFVMTDSELSGGGFEWWYGGPNIMTDDFVIERNMISGTVINFTDCKNGRFTDNTLTNMYLAINMYWNPSNILFQNNTIDGAYHSGINGTGSNLRILKNNFQNIWGQGIILWQGSMNAIEQNTFSNMHGPFYAINAQEDNTVIQNNNISNAFGGIIAGGSNLKENEISQCNSGIISGSNNTINSNIITECNLGLQIQENGNVVNSNIIMECDTGVVVSEAGRDNKFYQNDFINNYIQAIDFGETAWNYGGSGNYWSDYLGSDSNNDGIGDTPYQIYSNTWDNFPLMQPGNEYFDEVYIDVNAEDITPQYYRAGSINVPIAKLFVHVIEEDSGNTASLQMIRIDRTGTGLDSDISLLKIWRDSDGNANFSEQSDSLIGQGTFGEGTATVNFQNDEIITANETCFFVTVNIPQTVSDTSNTIGFSCQDSTYFITQFPDIVKNTNFPLVFSERTLPVEPENTKPINFNLNQNYPNPFNPITTVQYSLAKESHVNIMVYDILGREVNQLIKRNQLVGNHSIQWNGKDLNGNPVSAGIYFYQIKAGDFVQTKKMVLMK